MARGSSAAPGRLNAIGFVEVDIHPDTDYGNVIAAVRDEWLADTWLGEDDGDSAAGHPHFVR